MNDETKLGLLLIGMLIIVGLAIGAIFMSSCSKPASGHSRSRGRYCISQSDQLYLCCNNKEFGSVTGTYDLSDCENNIEKIYNATNIREMHE